MSPDEHLEAMYEDANGGDVDTACEVDEAFWEDFEIEEDE